MISADDLETDEEKLAEAAKRAAAFKRADRLALYAALAAGGLMAYFVFGYLGSVYEWVGEYAVPMLTFVFGAALLAKHIVTVIMYRVDDLGDVPLFGVWGRASSPPAPDPSAIRPGEWPIETVIPRLDPSAAARGVKVLTAPLQEGPSVWVSAGGRATTPVDGLPVGVVVLTEEGFVFYPDADAQAVHALNELKGAAWEIAKDTFKVLGVLGALGVGEPETPDASLPAWVERSVKHPEFFSFGWTELVEVRRQGAGVVTMCHEAADAPRAEHVFVSNDPRWPVLLMKARLRREMADTLIKKVRQPKAEELAPALVEQFRGIYGDRVGDHTAEMYAELNGRVDRALTGSGLALDAIAREGLAPVLPHYAKYPKIVESYSILFPGKMTSR